MCKAFASFFSYNILSDIATLFKAYQMKTMYVGFEDSQITGEFCLSIDNHDSGYLGMAV